MNAMRVRAVQPADWEAVNALHRWAWFPERSEAGWRWLHGLGQGSPGWVLEDRDGLCGHLGNIRQDYIRGRDRLTAATGYSLIVLPRAKGGSRPLLDVFKAQRGVFATSILNGNALSSPVYARNGLLPCTPAWADAKIVWPLAPLTIIAERMARSRYRSRRPERELFSKIARSPQVRAPGSPVTGLSPWRDADGINDFSSQLVQTGGLFADRSAESYQRRFSDPDRTTEPVLLGWWASGRIRALALGQLGKMSECEAPILDVVDLVWTGDEGIRAAASLLLELKKLGRRTGASRLRLPVVNGNLASVARTVPGAVIRRRHVHAHSRFPAGAAPAGSWAPTPFDGDFGFSLRPLPRPDVPASYPRAFISSGTTVL